MLANRGGKMDWIKEELKKIEEQRKQLLEQKDLRPFYRIPEGITEIEFSTEMPRDNPKFAGRKIFRIRVNGEEYDLSVTQNSNLYREILQNLAKGKTKLKVMRVGSGRNDTRYKVLE